MDIEFRSKESQQLTFKKVDKGGNSISSAFCAFAEGGVGGWDLETQVRIMMK